MSSGTILTTISAISDAGLKRANNEDSFLLADLHKNKSLADNCQVNYPIKDNILLLVVSDGVGGSQLGELASELTVLTIKDALSKMDKTQPMSDRLTAAVEQANHLLWHENIRDPKAQWMKATVTAAAIEGNIAYIATIGDSRAYIIRGGRIKQLTTDQTIMGVLSSRGMVKPEDFDKQPRNNMILQAIGNAQTLQVALTYINLEHGDYLLLCSDGLSGKMQDREMAQMVYYYASMEMITHQMVELAKQRGGEDNITVVLAKFQGEGLEQRADRSLTGEVQQVTIFDPYAETQKSQLRPNLMANLSERKVGIRFPLDVQGINTEVGTFVEQSETLQLGKMDASFLISYEVAVDDLLLIALPMPRELRLFDKDEPLYRIYVQVRKISPQGEGRFLIRVAFISKNNPEGSGGLASK